MKMETEKIIAKLREIALKDLHDCYHDGGIFASKINFSDYWARDTFWASLGLMEIGEFEKTKQSLELFLSYQRPDGKIPRKICLDYNLFKYIGFRIPRKKPRPIFTSPIKWLFSFDDNLLLVISFCKYIRNTQDLEFGKKYFGKISRALEFYTRKKLIKNSLLYETGLGNWMDTIFKHGAVLYTNCIWYRALKRFEELSKSLGLAPNTVLPKSSAVLEEVRNTFWLNDEGYFCDNVHGKTKREYFDLAGNVLAIIFEVADQEQAKMILDKANSIKEELHNLHPINYPRYPFWKISPATFLFGIHNYQNRNSWSWIEILLILAKIKTGQMAEAEKNLRDFSEVVFRNNSIYETYNLDGSPFDHLFWKSARPFAWSAGLLLWVLSEFDKIDKK